MERAVRCKIARPALVSCSNVVVRMRNESENYFASATQSFDSVSELKLENERTSSRVGFPRAPCGAVLMNDRTLSCFTSFLLMKHVCLFRVHAIHR